MLCEGFKLHQKGVICFVGAGGKTSMMFRLAHELALNGYTVLTTTTTKIFFPTSDQSIHVMVSDCLDNMLTRSKQLLKQTNHITAAYAYGPQRKLIGFVPSTIDAIFQSGLFQWILVEADGAAGMPIKAPADHEPVIPITTQWVIGMIGMDAVYQPITHPYVFRPHIFIQLTGARPDQIVSEEFIASLINHPKGIMKHCPTNACRIICLNKINSTERLAYAIKISEIIQKNNPQHINRILFCNSFLESPIIQSVDLL